MSTTVLIVSKTQMRNGVCVGGISETTCELIRIHNEYGGNLPSDTPYEIGDRWEMEVKTAWNVRPKPHIEDKQTVPIRKLGNVGINGIIDFINQHNFGDRLTRGSIESAFEGCLKFQGTKNFIDEDATPFFSTQFWIPDKDLIYCNSFGNDYYKYGSIRIKFVGLQDCIHCIPAGTIVRLSLANWWNGDGSGEDRCYLQLSGWYL